MHKQYNGEVGSMFGSQRKSESPPPSSSKPLTMQQPSYSALDLANWNLGSLHSNNLAHNGDSPGSYSSSGQSEPHQQQEDSPAPASSSSWPQDSPSPPPPPPYPFKRPATPSSVNFAPNKRHQSYNSPRAMNPSRANITKLLFFDPPLPDHEGGYRDQSVPPSSPYDHFVQNGMAVNSSMDPRYNNAETRRLARLGLLDRSHYSDPMASTRNERWLRAQSQEPSQEKSNSWGKPHQDKTPVHESRAYLLGRLTEIGGIHEYNCVSSSIPLEEHTSKLARFHRAQTVGPGIIHQDLRSRRKGELSHYEPHHTSPTKRPALGSPIRLNERRIPLPPPNLLPKKIFMQGNKPMVDPPTRENMERKRFERARSMSIHPQTPANQRSRGHGVILEDGSSPHTLHGYCPEVSQYTSHSEPKSSSGDSIDMKELFKRNQRRSRTVNQNFDSSPYDAGHILPNQGLFPQGNSAPLNAQLAVKSWLRNGEVQHGPPEFISIDSSPDNTPIEKPIKRSVPMKERIMPVKKAATMESSTSMKVSATSRRAATLKAKRAENEVKKLSPEELRQKKAAELIINKEINSKREALEMAIFGEIIGEDEETKNKRLEEQRAEAQAAREAKEIRDALQKEALRIVDLERKRQAEEAAEQARWQKEREEAQKKIVRDAERKKAEAAQERSLEEKRRLTVEKIEADRQKSAAEAEERERAKREAEEKAKDVQAENDGRAKLKAKQEEAKKQAASLSASRLLNPSEAAKEPEDEDSLFLPETSESLPGRSFLYHSNDSRSRNGLVGPNSAAEDFAHSASKSLISSYRVERDTMEAKMASEKALAARERLNARWKTNADKRAAARPQGRALIRDRPNAPKAAKKDRLPPKPKSKKSILSVFENIEEDSEAGTSEATGSASRPAPAATASQPQQTINHLNGSFSSVNTSFGSTQSAPAATQLKVYPSSIKLISELEREKVERRLAAEKAAKKSARTEAQKLARKKKDDEKAKGKRKQQLIDEAKEAGIELNEEMLQAQLEVYMAKREKENKRRTESRLRRERIENFAPDNLALEGFRAQGSSTSSPEALLHDTDNEDDTEEARNRRANQASVRESLDALIRVRGSRFAQAAQKKTVADLQSDTESEEDPDDILPNDGGVILMSDGSEFGESVGDEDEAQNEGTDGLNPNEYDAQVVEPLADTFPSFAKPSPRGCSKPGTSHCLASESTTDKPHNPSSTGQVYIYVVLQCQIINGTAAEQEFVERFVSRDDANSCARDRVESFRKKYEHTYPSVMESFDRDRLYSAQVWFDEARDNGVFTRISREPKATQDLANFDPSSVQKRLPETSWMLRRTIIKSEEGDDENIPRPNKESLIVPDFHYSNLVDVNYAACKHAFEFIRPKTASIDHVVQHENSWGPLLRNARDQLTEIGSPFAVECTVDEENLPWMKPMKQIDFDVEVFKMQGPIN